MRSDFESRLIRAEQLSRLYLGRAAKASDRVDRLGEMIFALVPGTYRDGGPPPPNTTVGGTITGCGGYPEGGATVVINPTGTGNATATVTTDVSGDYSGSIYLASGAMTAVRVTSSNPNYAVLNLTPTLAPGTNTVNGTLASGTGYGCLTNSGCHRPLVNSLTFTSTQPGVTSPRTLTYNSGGGPAGQAVWRSPADTSKSPVTVYLDANTLKILADLGGGVFGQLGTTMTSLSCSPFSVTWTSSGNDYTVAEP